MDEEELVTRLRESGSRSEVEIHEDREEAADRIEALEAENARFTADLKKLWVALTTYETKVREYASDNPTLSDCAYDWLHDDAGQTARAVLQDKETTND
jgi:hypothetical protein